MEFIQQNLGYVLLALGSGIALLVMSFRNAAGRSGLTPTQATLLINRENAQVIDVRGSDDYVGGHLPEARNIPLEHLEERAGELGKLKDTPLIVVCQSGTRSADACKKLTQLGFTRVNNLEGGISGWRSAGMPLKKGAKK